MVTDALALIQTAFVACVNWVTQLFDSVSAGPIIIVAFILVLIIGMFLMPIRGSSVSTDTFSDFMIGNQYKPKHWNGKVRFNIKPYKGKFTKKKKV